MVFPVVSFITYSFAEKEGAAFVLLVIMGLALAVLHGPEGVVAYIFSHKLFLFFCFLGYVAVGPFWALAKWYLYNIDFAEKFHDDYLHWMVVKQHNSERKIPEKFLTYERPRARDNKGRIIRWMVYWPLSVLDTLINDFLWKLFKRIYQFFEPLFDKMMDKYETWKEHRNQKNTNA